jgi:hypothetical protein
MTVPLTIGILLSLACWSNDATAFAPGLMVQLPPSRPMHVSTTSEPPSSPFRVVAPAPSPPPRRRRRGAATSLFVRGGGKDDGEDAAPPSSSLPVLERVRVDGVSVSPGGFHVLMETSSSSGGRRIVPLKVTTDPADAHVATSPESLTICQLVSGVDMAGAILPPEALSRLLVYHVEEKLQDLLEEYPRNDDADEGVEIDHGSSSTTSSRRMEETKHKLTPQERRVLDLVRKTLPEDQDFYKDAHPWLQSRIRLPHVTLDQLTLIPKLSEDVGGNDTPTGVTWHCRLECALPDVRDRIVLNVAEPDILASLAFNYDPGSSLLFTCLALALRYKAPIVLEQSAMSSTVFPTEEALDRDFPHRTTVSKLQQQSSRVAENIERGFEIHKLTGALQIAMRLGDERAAERIRAKLDEYDSLQDLPTIENRSPVVPTSTGNDEVHLGDLLSLDDLDKNILQ